MHRPVPRYSSNLPILEHREKIVSLLKKNQVLIVAGETGSGKTTQLPVICLEAGLGTNGKIGCTQPRRIAATSIAARVAQELNCILGNEVGYKIRFSDMDQPQTAIKFMTDGILLAEIEHDPLLRMYDTLIIDEAHERSLNIDFIIGYLRKILPSRPDLKVIISSATIDTELFSKSFNSAPVIEVSGRMYPVEVLYLDPSEDSEDKEDIDYINAAVRAVKDLVDLYGTGDMLIFMPTERDIRETCNKLNDLHLGESVVLPLFSRLSRSEQEVIFRFIDKRKIVVATNIAETSITVPGIRFVIDTGLARILRYMPRLRTNRLPVEPISRAAAQQRMGRCGRVMDGVCVRLYSEQEFLQREQFTLPEIKRSNLAGVVLSMIAHRLGSIEEFPFLEPPSRQSISEAYAQLRELSAIDKENNLTETGREMAALPLDPHIARMVLAAKRENALREVKIIASALSIVDPRERPFDKQAEADAAHKKFHDPASDFLLYVKLWDTYQREWQTLKTQGRMRKFCKEHFLSFIRMQEWHDVYQQVHETVKKLPGYKDNLQPASYDTIHRALLSGLLTNCALKNENGRFTAAKSREVLIFPGSVLAGQKKIDWIMCHEIVETSQVFARTVAIIKPQWLEEIGAHLCSRSYSEPYFDEDSGMVKADETVSVFSLPVARHNGIRYGRIDSKKATSVFIWKGLVEGNLRSYHKFYLNNKKVREEVEILEAKLRTRSLFAGEQSIFDFYSTKIYDVSSVHDLNRFVKEHDDQFLFMTKEDLLVTPVPDQNEKIPDKVAIGEKSFSLKYSFNPGTDDDGVTMTIPAHEIPYIAGNSFGWLLPHLWPDQIYEFLKHLPKELRKKLMPLNEKAQEIASVLTVSPEPFEKTVTKVIKKLYDIDIAPDTFSKEVLPPHLSLRFEVSDNKGNIIASGRNLPALSYKLTQDGTDSWKAAVKIHERYGIKAWDFGDIADSVEIASSENGVPLYGYPVLSEADGTINLIIMKSSDEAVKVHKKGVKHLLEIAIVSEITWVEREIRFSQQIKLLCSPFGGPEKIKSALLKILKEHLLKLPEQLPRKQVEFEVLVDLVKKQTAGIGYEALSLVEKTLLLFNECLSRISKESRTYLQNLKTQLKSDLRMYIERFLDGLVSYEIFRQYPRFLKAFTYRIERAFNDPSKFNEKREILNKYRIELNKFEGLPGADDSEVAQLRMMIEEFAISLFAQQEVKTIFPVSIQRLDKKVEEIRGKLKK